MYIYMYVEINSETVKKNVVDNYKYIHRHYTQKTVDRFLCVYVDNCGFHLYLWKQSVPHSV